MASAIPFIAADFKLSPLRMGEVLSAFFVGYALMQIPGGVLADRFGPRVVLSASIGWFSLMTALTGCVPGLNSMLAVRILFGLGEGSYPSAAAKAVSNWFPAREVGRANGLQLGATGLGATVAPLFVVALVERWGWRSVFFVLLFPGLLFTLLVWRYVLKLPTTRLGVSPDASSDKEVVSVEPSAVRQSLLEALRTPAVRWCAACLFFANLVNWGLMNWLPTYLLQARGFGAERMGFFAGITNFAAIVGSALGGYLCDRYFSRHLRVPILTGLLASAGFTYLAAGAPTGEMAVVYLTLVFLISNIAFTAIFTLPLLIVRQQAVGATFGIVNTSGQLAGVLSPLLVGYLLKVTSGSFEVVLYSMVALTFIAMYPASQIRQSSTPNSPMALKAPG